jgi:hypothetical protein
MQNIHSALKERQFEQALHVCPYGPLSQPERRCIGRYERNAGKMIKIFEDGNEISTVSLIDGKLKIEGRDLAVTEMLIDHIRKGWGDRLLTDEEIYSSLPFRIKDRTSAGTTTKAEFEQLAKAYKRLEAEQEEAIEARAAKHRAGEL